MGVMLDSEYEAMFSAEESHWWYQGLHDQVLLALQAARDGDNPRRILDAGCGTGKMLELLHAERTFGFDLSGEALRLAARRTPGRFVQATTLSIPYLSGAFDAVLSLDVLSNVPQHAVQDVLHELFRVLKPGGRLVLNATAFQWLYSEHDRAVGVVRRYTASEVRRLLEDAGFEIDRCGYSNSILFLPAAFYRLAKRILPERKGDPTSDLFALPGWINSLLFRIRFLENRLIHRLGVNMPAGLSVFALARRPARSSTAQLLAQPCELQADFSSLDVSVVIPVYNAEKSIAPLCVEIMSTLSCRSLQIVLVNDGSRDASHEACLGLCERHPDVVTYLNLSRNFGEHNAVMAGLKAARGDYTLILDDDFQNPPSEAPPLLAHCVEGGFDAVYGAFIEKRHSFWRNLGSRLNGRMSRWLLGKPEGLYLSSFKCLNRFLREKVIEYTGPWPYLDGLILRSTDRIGQVAVEHHHRTRGVSGYTPAKLISLWLTMFASFSPAPARLTAATGLLFALAGIGTLAAGLAVWSVPWMLGGLACLLGGAILTGTGLAAEYAARALMELNGAPQYVVRERHGAGYAPGKEIPRGQESGTLPKPGPDTVTQTGKKKKAISSREYRQ